MPPCYSIEITFTKDKIVNGFVEKIYNTIFESGFHFKSGYWYAEHMTLKKIIKVNQDKLTKGFELGFTQHVKHDYKQILLDTSLYSEMRVYWMLMERKVNLNLIIPEEDLLVENTGYTPIEENGVTMIMRTILCIAGIPSIGYLYNRQCLDSLQEKVLPANFIGWLLYFSGEIFDFCQFFIWLGGNDIPAECFEIKPVISIQVRFFQTEIEIEPINIADNSLLFLLHILQ